MKMCRSKEAREATAETLGHWWDTSCESSYLPVKLTRTGHARTRMGTHARTHMGAHTLAGPGREGQAVTLLVIQIFTC